VPKSIKSSSRQSVPAPGRIKTAVCLSPEAFRRLGAACVSEHMSQSQLVELMINRLLSGYVISVRGPGVHASPVGSIDRPGDAADVNLAGASAA
jgi:hypothetical protein